MSDNRFDQFRAAYEVRHPASIPVRRMEASPYPRWVSWAAGLMFAFSALLSGVHTVPVVRDGIPADVFPLLADFAAVTSFFSVELAILISTFILAGGGSLAVRGVLALSTMTALAANLYSVFAAYTATITESGGDIGMLAVAVLIGIVAPGVAFMSGKMYVNIARANRTLNNQADARYAEEKRAWDAEINAAFEQAIRADERRQQEILDRQAQESAEERAIRLAAEEQERKRRLDMEDRERKVRLDMERREFETRMKAEELALEERMEQIRLSASASPSARTKRTSGRGAGDADGLSEVVQQVVDYLSTHPDAIKLPVRDLAELVGVGKTSAASGKNAYLEMAEASANGRQNGHGKLN